MPIRAYCTICSDFFDNCRDVAAIHCGHTFHYECLLQWFQTAPTKTCPQCRKQVSTRHIISKLFFDIGEEESGAVDPESLQNELARMKALLSSKEKDWRDKQKTVDSLKDTVDKQRRDLDSLQKEIVEKEMLCSALRKQMTFLETQQNDIQAAKEEARRLRTKMKTFESLDVMLQGHRSEVESMIADMGVSQSAVEQLSIYCISLKKEYDNLKGTLMASNDMREKLKREVLSSNNKSLKKKVEFLQKSLSSPTRTNEALSRLMFESPAPMELKQPHLHQPVDSDDIDLNMTYDIHTPDHGTNRQTQAPPKKMCLDPLVRDEDGSMDSIFRNSLLFRKKTFGSMLEPQMSRPGNVRTGYDGLGGRTRFIQPSPVSEIRPLLKTKRKKVTRPPPKISACQTLDNFLE
uniref:TRAF-interacting protein n=1 Tax=Sphaeramia orbicularis TaxID=375764 RepID=A0A672YNF2_9TELE